jgi:DNA-binding XRE family transcriptional regulator
MRAILEPIVTATQVLKVPRRESTFGYMGRSTITKNFADRLNEVLDEAGMPEKFDGRQVALAKIFDVSQKGARKWLEGEGLPTLERCIEIATHFGVNTEWLVSGRGPKRDGSEQDQMIASLPEEVRQETFDFLGFKLSKQLTGDQLAHYLRWIDRIKRNPPGRPSGEDEQG